MLTLHKNICCDPSSEPSPRDGSNEGSQHIVLMKKKIITKYSLLSRAQILYPASLLPAFGQSFIHLSKWTLFKVKQCCHFHFVSFHNSLKVCCPPPTSPPPPHTHTHKEKEGKHESGSIAFPESIPIYLNPIAFRTLLHSEQPKLHRVSAILSAVGLKTCGGSLLLYP